MSVVDRHRVGERVAERLRVRREELEAALLTRARGISGGEELEPTQAERLRITVRGAVEYGLDGVLRGERRPPLVPTVLLAQARLAQRQGAGLDIVLRRYLSGYMLFNDFLVEEAQEERVTGDQVKTLLRGQAICFDRLLAAVSEEFQREARSRATTAEQERSELVRRLLAGELVDAGDLGYDFDGHHLALIVAGPRTDEAVGALALDLEDCRKLTIRAGDETHWLWLGRRKPIDPRDPVALMGALPTGVCLAIGEPGQGLAGWRLSHRQAAAVLPVALEVSAEPVRYADAGLLASIRRDDLLAASLRQRYLEPLEHMPDGGRSLRDTLRAYFECGRNVSSAAMKLGISRQTTNTRLRTVEDLLESSLVASTTQLEIALQISDEENVT